MDILPTDIYINIFKYLPFDFIKTSLLSKHFNTIYKSIKRDVAHSILTQIFDRISYKSSFAIYDFIYIRYYDILDDKIDFKLVCTTLNAYAKTISSDTEYNRFVMKMLQSEINLNLEDYIKCGDFRFFKYLLKIPSLKYLDLNFDKLLHLFIKRDYYYHIITLLEYIAINEYNFNVDDLIKRLILNFPNSVMPTFRRGLDHNIITIIIKLLSKSKHGINPQRKLLKKYANVNNNIQLIEFLNEI